MIERDNSVVNAKMAYKITSLVGQKSKEGQLLEIGSVLFVFWETFILQCRDMFVSFESILCSMYFFVIMISKSQNADITRRPRNRAVGITG